MNNPAEIHTINPQLLDRLDGLLAGWERRALTPSLPYLAELRPLQIREIETIVLDPKEHDCPWGEEDGVPCGCDWHVDGGMRGFKLWTPLEKEVRPDAHEHQNIVVAPFNNVQQLCDLANSLNASGSVGPREAPADVWEMRSDSDGSRGWRRDSGYEVESRKSDKRALQAASCIVATDPGDLLLFFPGIFHRTQDVDGHRVAIIAEATR